MIDVGEKIITTKVGSVITVSLLFFAPKWKMEHLKCLIFGHIPCICAHWLHCTIRTRTIERMKSTQWKTGDRIDWNKLNTWRHTYIIIYKKVVMMDRLSFTLCDVTYTQIEARYIWVYIVAWINKVIKDLMMSRIYLWPKIFSIFFTSRIHVLKSVKFYNRDCSSYQSN